MYSDSKICIVSVCICVCVVVCGGILHEQYLQMVELVCGIFHVFGIKFFVLKKNLTS